MKIRIPQFLLQKGRTIRIEPKPLDGEDKVQSIEQQLKRKTAQALIDSLGDADPFVRAISSEVLGRLRERGAVAQLINSLHDPSKYVREKAAIALGISETGLLCLH